MVQRTMEIYLMTLQIDNLGCMISTAVYCTNRKPHYKLVLTVIRIKSVLLHSTQDKKAYTTTLRNDLRT